MNKIPIDFRGSPLQLQAAPLLPQQRARAGHAGGDGQVRGPQLQRAVRRLPLRVPAVRRLGRGDRGEEQELTAVVDTAVLQAPALGESRGEERQEFTAAVDTACAPHSRHAST